MDKSGKKMPKKQKRERVENDFLHDGKWELHGLKSLLHEMRWEEKV